VFPASVLKKTEIALSISGADLGFGFSVADQLKFVDRTAKKFILSESLTHIGVATLRYGHACVIPTAHERAVYV
jgi:hypothetical protein